MSKHKCPAKHTFEVNDEPEQYEKVECPHNNCNNSGVWVDGDISW